MNELLEAALGYARQGFPVFPVWPVMALGSGFACMCIKTIRCESPGKHPMARLVRHGLTDASTDENLIRHWWACRSDANVGVCTRGLVVTDVDPNRGGNNSMRDLVRRHGKLPPTWRVITGGGGRHVYFGDPTGGKIRSGVNVLGPGVDIRADGGYVVAPPSNHKSGGRYQWENGRSPADLPLGDVPDWMVTELARPVAAAAHTPAHWRAFAASNIAAGGRNDAITRLSGLLLRRYLDPVVTLELMRCFNAARCQPPLEDEEVAKIVGSITEREIRRAEKYRGAR